MKINIDDLDDDLDGRWWHYIRACDFAFQSRIPNQNEVEVNDDDVLLHKEIKEGERFPSKRFHLIMDGEAFQVEGNEIRDILTKKLGEYLKVHNKLPFGCIFQKLQKNGVAIINYNPNNFDNFQLRLSPVMIEKQEDEMEEFIKTLEEEKTNLLGDADDITLKIKPISEHPILEQVSVESGSNKAFVINAKIMEIDKRKSFFQGNETIFYLLQVKGGKLAADKKKDSLQRDFDILNVKCSENAIEKFELKMGDIISFNGQVKNDNKLKIIVQNVRKFEKT